MPLTALIELLVVFPSDFFSANHIKDIKFFRLFILFFELLAYYKNRYVIMLILLELLNKWFKNSYHLVIFLDLC